MQSCPALVALQVVPAGQVTPAPQGIRRQKPPSHLWSGPQVASVLQLLSTQVPLPLQRRPVGQSPSTAHEALHAPKLH
jgi:hypothetical protein